MKQPVRIGIVGAGANTRKRHIPGLQRIDGVEVVSVANRSRSSAERVAETFSIGTVYDSWEELVAAPDTDAIVIGTWPCMHCPITLAALEAGKHVLCEARMAMNADEAHRMLAAAKQHPEQVAQIVPSPITLKVDQTVIRILKEGRLGDLPAIELFASPGTFPDRNAPLNWRQDADRSGMNVLLLGIWYEALMRWVGEASEVTAKGKVAVTHRLDPETGTQKKVLIPDHLSVIANMNCGAQATLLMSSVTGGCARNEALLYGSEATLRIRGEALSICTRNSTGFSPVEIPPEEEGGWCVEEEFIAAIRGTAAVTRTSFEDGVKYMEFTEAVFRSVQTGGTVPVRQ
jgi:predicted dehydrogenase